MNFYPIFGILTIVFIAGCSDSTVDQLTEMAPDQTTDGQSNLSVALFPGATFVSVITSSIGSNQAGARTSPNQVITFDADSVTSTQSGVTETGPYSYTESNTLVAQLPDRDISFSIDGGNLIWDSLSFQRAATSQFSSQESLMAFLDGSIYKSVEQLDIGENAAGELVLGNWSISIIGDQLSHAVQDTVSVGTYSYVDGSSFTMSLFQQDTSAVVLDGDRLVVDSVTYEKELTDQFNSQETLVAFLDGQSYKSVDLKYVGESSGGSVMLGNWFVDFVDNTFSQTLQETVEVGTVVYLDNSRFSAITDNQSTIVEVENDELVWGNVRYKRTVGE